MSHQNPPLWKQIAGAVIGGTLALGLYYGYETVKPYASQVTAYVTLPGGDVERTYDPGIARINDSSLEANEAKRFASRNRQVADRARMKSGATDSNSYLETDDINPFTVDWPTYQKTETPDEPEEVMVEDTNDLDSAMDTQEDPWKEFPWDEQQEEPTDDAEMVAMNADALPSSGVETWILALCALLCAGYVRYRKEIRAVLTRS